MTDLDICAPSAELQGCLLEHQEELLIHTIQFHDLMKNDFHLHNTRACITMIQTRIKTPVSILNKLKRKNIPISMESIRTELNDVAGIRVICSFIDDIYMLAEKLRNQDDINIVSIKDYIQNPKPNGYRSYHMIMEVPVFFSEAKEYVRVELQIRTVAMDFWASLEHNIKYKKDVKNCDNLVAQLKACADTIADTDHRMMKLRDQIIGGASKADTSSSRVHPDEKHTNCST